MRRRGGRKWVWCGVLGAAVLGWSAASGTEPQPEIPTVVKRLQNLERHPGLLTIYLDRQRGRILLEIPPPNGHRGEVGQYLYYEGLVQGMGSNPVGLDRGRLGEGRLLTLRRLGGRVLAEEENLRYRALTPEEAERRAVQQSFATSVVWAGDIEARDADGRALVDFTDFVIRDAHGVARQLETSGQGTFKLDGARSAVDLDACLAFPENVELEAVLTFETDEGSSPGPEVRSTVPAPESLTVVLHQSLVRLPPPGYEPRRFDPRAGSFAVEFLDYAAPLDRPLETRWIVRHRLQKLDPAESRSRVREPISYYVDPGTPPPVRSALIEGASWWARAFEEVGFEDAFQVRLLPPDAHPLDVRYNVIQWVHRATRGWSYGGGVIDPRSGEMLKGHVRLGSQRVRQDRLIFQGLLGTAHLGLGTPEDPVQLALARIRQLAAHEVGHALGLAHNFAASTYGRASVMDYPAPWIKVGEGGLDVSSAYGVGVGEWDVHAIRYAYSQFPPGSDEESELDEIVSEGLERGLLFLSDDDARPAGAAEARASLWDNGEDLVEELENVLRVRRLALSRFGRENVSAGQPLALLQEVLAPLYFYHRYQLEAAVKLVGGLEYGHAVRGDGQPPARPVPAAEQRRALQAILAILEPEVLDLPEPLLALLLPRPAGYAPNRELFASATAPAFDALGAAASAADHVVAALVQSERAARLVDQARRQPELPGLEEVLAALVERVFEERGVETARRRELRRVVETVVVARLLALASAARAPARVTARVEGALERLVTWLAADDDLAPVERVHRGYLRRQVERFLQRQTSGEGIALAAQLPPGPPIGGAGLSGCSVGEPGGGSP